MPSVMLGLEDGISRYVYVKNPCVVLPLSIGSSRHKRNGNESLHAVARSQLQEDVLLRIRNMCFYLGRRTVAVLPPGQRKVLQQRQQ